MIKSYAKFLDTRDGRKYITSGADYCEAVNKAAKHTPVQFRRPLGWLIQTPEETTAGVLFFQNAIFLA